MADMIKRLQQVLDQSVESGEECGCQLTVYRHGKLICDLTAGHTDADRTTPVTVQTLFPVFSVGKGIITTLFHILAEKGCIDYDTPVVRYWPEYGINGKESTLVWHILSHRAGLFSFPADFPFTDRFNWDKAPDAVICQAPLDTIGGKHHYHAHTFGLLTGRLLEKATGRTLREMFRTELLDPLQIDSLFFGLPDERIKDLAKLVPYVSPDGISHTEDERILFNDLRVLQGLNPSSNGTANAHSLAKIYASLLEDGVDGCRFLKDTTLNRALTMLRAEDDPAVRSQWDIFGLGYALCGPTYPWNRMFGHGGACGAEGFADRETGYAVGFTKNKINATHPDHPTRNEISKVLGIPVRIW